MKEVDYTNAYAMALAQFNLMQIKQENELLKTTAGATVSIPAYNFLPVSRVENIGSSVRFSDYFEPIKPPEDDDYKKGWLDGWIACTEMFVKVETATCWYVVYHKDTKVMYAVSAGDYNGGTFTLLVDADGKPMIYEGE